MGFLFCLLCFNAFEINKVGILLQYPNKRFPIRKFWFWPPPDWPGLHNLDNLVCYILLSVFVLSPDCMHRTLHSGIQCIGAMHFHHSIIFWIFRRTWKQPHRQKTPVIERMATPTLQLFDVWIQFSHSSQFASPHYFSSCTDKTHPISQNSMNSVRVGHCLMVSFWMLRYHTTQGGYSIGFMARQDWCLDPRGWDWHCPRAIS